MFWDLQGIIHPEMKAMWWFTYPHVVSNPYDVPFSGTPKVITFDTFFTLETEQDFAEVYPGHSFQYSESERGLGLSINKMTKKAQFKWDKHNSYSVCTIFKSFLKPWFCD